MLPSKRAKLLHSCQHVRTFSDFTVSAVHDVNGEAPVDRRGEEEEEAKHEINVVNEEQFSQNFEADNRAIGHDEQVNNNEIRIEQVNGEADLKHIAAENREESFDFEGGGVDQFQLKGEEVEIGFLAGEEESEEERGAAGNEEKIGGEEVEEANGDRIAGTESVEAGAEGTDDSDSQQSDDDTDEDDQHDYFAVGNNDNTSDSSNNSGFKGEDLLDEDGNDLCNTEGSDGGDNDEDDDSAIRMQLDSEEDDEEEERRKQLVTFMCFSSFQTLMTMELCREVGDPLDGENSVMLPTTFMKMILLAVTGLVQEEGQQSWKPQRLPRDWSRVERRVGSIDAATRDSIWRRKYSMSYPCFLYLVEALKPHIQSDSQFYVRAPLEVQRAVAMVLNRLAHGLSVREVAEKYNVGASTVGKYTRLVVSALCDVNKLYGRFVSIPRGEQIVRIISQFQQITNMPQMCGAIDGTHVRLHFKPDKPDSLTNQSLPVYHSILLQAVCDPNKIFWDVCCMTPGSVHEAAEFISSKLYQKMKDGLSLQEPLLSLENKEVTPYMVGDSAYPLRPFLMTPFDTNDVLRRAFNEQLQKGLTYIHSAFAILRARWKILKVMKVNLVHAPQLIVACCVLHNICQSWGEPEPSHELVEWHADEFSEGLPLSYEIDDAARIAGEAVREALFKDWIKRKFEIPNAV